MTPATKAIGRLIMSDFVRIYEYVDLFCFEGLRRQLPAHMLHKLSCF